MSHCIYKCGYIKIGSAIANNFSFELKDEQKCIPSWTSNGPVEFKCSGCVYSDTNGYLYLYAYLYNKASEVHSCGALQLVVLSVLFCVLGLTSTCALCVENCSTKSWSRIILDLRIDLVIVDNNVYQLYVI